MRKPHPRIGEEQAPLPSGAGEAARSRLGEDAFAAAYDEGKRQPVLQE